MHRAPIVITATVLGTAGVLLFKTPSTASVAAATGERTATTPASTTATAASTAAPSPTTTSGSTTSTTSGAKDGTFTGAAETVRFGTTQVRVTISGGRITDVTVLAYNSDDPRSEQISQDAFPTLRSEVLAKQSAAVDTVSGATYTSAQYEASLQSALDAAGYTAPDGTTASTDVSNIQESGGFGH